MKKSITKEYLDSLVGYDWSVDKCGDEFELSGHSPAGENVVVTLSGKTLKELIASVKSELDGFNPEDHAARIYHAKHYGTEDARRFYAGAPDDLQDLIEDANAIVEMYGDLINALEDAVEEE